MSNPIASPCTKVCTIDPASRLCRGCGRSLDEIAGWMSLSDSERALLMGGACAKAYGWSPRKG